MEKIELIDKVLKELKENGDFKRALFASENATKDLEKTLNEDQKKLLKCIIMAHRIVQAKGIEEAYKIGGKENV